MPRDLYDLSTIPNSYLRENMRPIIHAALVAAAGSRCAKDQRGAVVWRRSAMYRHRAASNGPPAPFACDGSEACRAACGKLAVHAEERALLMFIRETQFPGDDIEVLHLAISSEGKPVPSGPPSCITCSRTILEAGVVRVWLWHEEGWTVYDAADFHARSLAHPKHALPIIRRA